MTGPGASLQKREPELRPTVVVDSWSTPWPESVRLPNREGLGEYLRILRKRKWTVLAVVMVICTLTLIASFRATPLYSAYTRVVINRENPEALGFKDIANSNTEDMWDYKVALQTYLEILESDMLALQVISELKLHEDQRFYPAAASRTKAEAEFAPAALDPGEREELLKIFRRSLKVTTIARTRMVEVEFLSPDPKLSAEVLNTLVKSFVEQNYKAKYESMMQTSEWLSAQLVDLQRKVEISQEKLVQYQREKNILGLDEKQNITTVKLDELNKQVTAAETDRIRRQAEYALTKSGNLELIPALANNRLIEQLKAEETQVRQALAQAETKFGPAYPKVVELRNELEQVQVSLRNELKGVAGRLENEYKSALERERMLRAALEMQKQEANLLNESAIRFTQLRREFETNRQLYEDLLTKLKEASVSAGLRSNNIRVVDVAQVPARPSKPNIPLNFGLAFIGSLALGLVLVFALETFDNSVRTAEDVEITTSIPSLGLIPLSLPERNERQNGDAALAPLPERNKSATTPISIANPKSHIAEAYRALRTSLMLSFSGAPPKVLLVTSALPMEGKTTTSINLAAVLAQKGGRVLLVDADLRRPRIHHDFGLSPNPGLSAVLAGAEEGADHIRPSAFLPNLSVITAGPPPPFPAELLGSSAMRDQVAQWRQSFDHIVIDSPPVLAVTDAVLLSSEADGVVLVTRSGKTTKPALRRAARLLRDVGARILGVALNGVDLSTQDSYYYHYGYSNASYGTYYGNDEESSPPSADGEMSVSKSG